LIGSSKVSLSLLLAPLVQQKVLKKKAFALIISKVLPYICVAFLKSDPHGGYSSVG
jgi:hypothetical protein